MTPETETTGLRPLMAGGPYKARFIEYNRGKREYMKEASEREVEVAPPVGQMFAMGDALFVVEFCYTDFETGIITVALHRETAVRPYVPGAYQGRD